MMVSGPTGVLGTGQEAARYRLHHDITMTVNKGRFSSGGAIGSVAASASATPAPPSLAEQLSFHSAPRPYKNPEFAARMARISSNLSRRNKSLKQILQAEHEAAMRAAGAKFKERKKKDSSAQKAKLVGAALKAFSRREERERAAALEAGTASADPTAPTTSTNTAEPSPPPTTAGDAEVKEEAAQDGDMTMQTEPDSEQPADAGAEDKKPDPAKPKRDVPSYASVEAPPSLRPPKKYCDITGLVAPYTDPKSKLRYHSVEVYDIIKTFGPGVDNAYLSLRGDASQIM
ncbi:hypothetical protein BCV70DRAFT_238964 [Testicularia cyperi]|uniref:Vps72/YL1 C-terminal domain-containing protein n=1 Tax=Testicularia cyperi TaxID=1882483 RepID=A0A317XJK8_9BASI|nr:hypothetical protein BCV70DRAFT_238964 [Testicularia cyperi]